MTMTALLFVVTFIAGGCLGAIVAAVYIAGGKADAHIEMSERQHRVNPAPNAPRLVRVPPGYGIIRPAPPPPAPPPTRVMREDEQPQKRGDNDT